LGLQEGALLPEIRAAWLEGIRRCHPDLATSEQDRVERNRAAARLNVAYAELQRMDVCVPQTIKQTSNATVPNAPTHRATPAQDRPRAAASEAAIANPWTKNLSLADLYALAGAIAGGILVSSVVGTPILCVGALVAMVVVGRWPKAKECSW
jgi:hypothetical protein